MNKSMATTVEAGWSRGAILLIGMMALLCMPLAGCDSGSDEEVMYQKALSSVNETWEIYELTKQGTKTVIRVEVSENVPFKLAKKAGVAIQKADPAFDGYVEFFNSEVGMVLRKLEIFPAT